ncbi:MAG: YjhX family toxin [Pseudomonadota bacterium]
MNHRRSALTFVRSGMATDASVNISRTEQRHLPALGGSIDHSRSGGNTGDIPCVTRDGLILTDCTPGVLRRPRRKRLIASDGGGPCRISRLGRLGRLSVRAQADTQG